MNNPENKIIEKRNLIDKIDNQIFELFTKRFNLSKLIGNSKVAKKAPVLDKSRESDILSRLTNDFKDKLEPEHIKILIEAIFSVSRDLQKLKK